MGCANPQERQESGIDDKCLKEEKERKEKEEKERKDKEEEAKKKSNDTPGVVGAGGNTTNTASSHTCGTKIEHEGQSYKTVQIGTQCWFKENLNSGTRWCYGDKAFLCKSDGGLYSWRNAMVACPSGWHLPSDTEFDILISTQKVIPGVMLGVDNPGFVGLNAGYRTNIGSWKHRGAYAGMWTSTDKGADAWIRQFGFGFSNVKREVRAKTWGLSVRCLKD